MGERIVEQGLKKVVEKSIICSWLPDSSFGQIDWEHNRCKPGCDGNDISCSYHPSYNHAPPKVESGVKDLVDYRGL